MVLSGTRRLKKRVSEEVDGKKLTREACRKIEGTVDR
jgi:hypothetical protein